MKLSFSIAKRFLFSNKSQTILIAFGIAVGVSVQIFIGMLIQSLQIGLVDTTIGSSSHITISEVNNNSFSNYEDTIKNLNSNNNFLTISPVIDKSVVLNQDNEALPILLKGVEYSTSTDIYKIEDKLITGVLPINNNEIIVGSDLFLNNDLKLGDILEFNISDNNIVNLKIVGVYDFEVKSINELWIFTNIKTMQENIINDNTISYIGTQIKEVFDADIIASNIVLDDNLISKTWLTENEKLLSGLNGQNISSLMIQIFVMISVILGIASVLIITVVQKAKQVGILKAMGLTNLMASNIFIFQGLMLGIIGSSLGVLLGIGLLKGFTTFAVDANGESIINIYMNYRFILNSFLIATLASVIASLIPSIRSAKLSPMEVIRNA